MKTKIYLIPAIIATLLLILFIALKPTKAKADIYNPGQKSFTQLNEGYDYPYYYYKSGYNLMTANYDYIEYLYTTNFSYIVINLWSDVAKINTIFCYLCSNASQSTYFINGEYALMCGFYSGVIKDSNNSPTPLDSVLLPYTIPKDWFLNENSNALGYIDVSEYDIQPEGGLYFICRYTNAYRLAYNVNNRPQFLISDLKIDQTVYNNGYTEEEVQSIKQHYFNMGLNEGYDRFYNAGYQEGYDTGYTTGQNSVASNSAQYEAGFEAGVNSNSLKIGGVITSILSGLTNFLNIQIFGGITLGGVMLLPIMFGALWLVLKLLRG